MRKIAIIGGGAFGTAMACVGRRAGHETVIWAREPEVVQSINAGRGNPLFLEGIAIEAGIAATSDLYEAIRNADCVLIAVPAQFLRGVTERMRPAMQAGTPVISCSKGIERGTCALMPEVIAEALPTASVAVLAGPSFAKEVARGLVTGVTLASADQPTAARVADALSSRAFRIYTSDDPISATIGGAYKNVLAIAIGITMARNMGENVRGLLIARGLFEMASIARAKGGNPVNLLGLAGSGDVVLTCIGTQSRNTTFGIALGQGRSAADILAERKVVTEGVHTAASITELAHRLSLELPIASAVNRIVNGAASIDDTIAEVLALPIAAEISQPN
ncbi:MAG TPA: NAD(P)H-dependent glycerol-3-phosphate dehydrogenase [Xanthobacteraceae bacterium]|nr:NAD(P)H-dependent glycerol-3-phosphate dehydrogenase [Xanthobacteraceae bacterium]